MITLFQWYARKTAKNSPLALDLPYVGTRLVLCPSVVGLQRYEMVQHTLPESSIHRRYGHYPLAAPTPLRGGQSDVLIIPERTAHHHSSRPQSPLTCSSRFLSQSKCLIALQPWFQGLLLSSSSLTTFLVSPSLQYFLVGFFVGFLALKPQRFFVSNSATRFQRSYCFATSLLFSSLFATGLQVCFSSVGPIAGHLISWPGSYGPTASPLNPRHEFVWQDNGKFCFFLSVFLIFLSCQRFP